MLPFTVIMIVFAATLTIGNYFVHNPISWQTTALTWQNTQLIQQTTPCFI
jgi:hypothetical protein